MPSAVRALGLGQHTQPVRAEAEGASSGRLPRAQSSRGAHPQAGPVSSRGCPCVPRPPTPAVGGKHVPRECPGREMTASGEWSPPRGAELRAPSRFQGRPGRRAADRTRDRACFRDPCPRPESHARPGTQPGALPGGGGAGAPGPRLRAAATLPARPPRPPPRRPGLPAAAASTYFSARAGRGPRLRWRRGGAGKASLGPSAPHKLRLEARRGRNKRAPLPAGAGHCATSSGRDSRPAGRRASLARPALRPLPSGLRAAASARPRPRGARPPKSATAQAPPKAPPQGVSPGPRAAGRLTTPAEGGRGKAGRGEAGRAARSRDAARRRFPRGAPRSGRERPRGRKSRAARRMERAHPARSLGSPGAAPCAPRAPVGAAPTRSRFSVGGRRRSEAGTVPALVRVVGSTRCPFGPGCEVHGAAPAGRDPLSGAGVPRGSDGAF